MPASPDAASSSASARAAAGSEPVSSATRVASSAPPSMPAVGEVAEHGGDRAVVLLGEHLGRGEQRRLAAGVDDPQHRAQRDDGLAGADLALEQPVHRVVAARSAAISSSTSRCPSVSSNGSRASKASKQPAGPTGARLGRASCALLGAALGERHLRDERLVEPQPLRRRPGLLAVVRAGGSSASAVELEQPVLARTPAGSGSGTSSTTSSASRTASRDLSRRSLPVSG